jgi:hypothetical protein
VQTITFQNQHPLGPRRDSPSHKFHRCLSVSKPARQHSRIKPHTCPDSERGDASRLRLLEDRDLRDVQQLGKLLCRQCALHPFDPFRQTQRLHPLQGLVSGKKACNSALVAAFLFHVVAKLLSTLDCADIVFLWACSRTLRGCAGSRASSLNPSVPRRSGLRQFNYLLGRGGSQEGASEKP